MSKTTRALQRAVTRRHNPAPNAIDGDLARAVAQQLEDQRIAQVPGLPAEQSPEWFDIVIEHRRQGAAYAAERDARQLSERQAQEIAAVPTTSMILGEIAKSATRSGSTAIPLNGAAVLRAALNGGAGTVNGDHLPLPYT